MPTTMRVSVIVAMDRAGLIGVDGGLAWRLPDDLAHFRRVTLGKPCIMGRKTFLSLPRPLADRVNIVVTSRPAEVIARAEEAAAERPWGPGREPEVLCANSFERALERARGTGAEESMVIGGAALYAAAMPRADRMYLTSLHTTIDTGDAKERTYFPTEAWSSRPRRIVRFEPHIPTAEVPFRWSIQVFDLA